jgi:curved DNA-binding protein CbpA
MNYYEILGVSRTASHDEIAKTFRTLAKEFHPDINKSSNAKTRFIEIYEAYSILKDDKKRSVYDQITFYKSDVDEGETTNNTTYSGWTETAKTEAKYYSETKYQEFAEKVLKNIKAFSKTTIVILLFFIAMILCGLFSKYFITPVINTKIENAIQSSNQETYSQNKNDITPNENTEKGVTLPLPLTPLLEDWKRIYIDNIGTIDFPPTMEIQSGKYKEIKDTLKPELMKQMGVISNPNYDIIIQQKGLNDLNENGYQKYLRVMLNTDIGNIGDYDTLSFNIGEYSISDISELNNLFRSLTEAGMKGAGLKITNWFPLKIEKVNGMSCIHISYERQLNNNPIVIVSIYKFMNVDRMYNLTLSYRRNEEEYWSNDFNTILKSFRIENIN